jgi:hypothetical protein
VLENEVGILSRKLPLTEQGGVSGPRVAIERVDGHGQTRTNRVQVNVANELEEVRLLLDEDALEAVLEEVSGAAVDTVEGADIGGEPRLNEAGEGEVAGTEQCVGMLWGAVRYVQRVS